MFVRNDTLLLNMETKVKPQKKENNTETTFDIVVQSIGSAGVGLIPALKKVSPLSENKIASLLFQTPAKLFEGLPESVAKEINELLLSTGLESYVISEKENFQPGDNNHEVALVINDYNNIQEIAKNIVTLTGLPIEDIRKVLCKSPTVLIGKISKNSAEAIRSRFEVLGVEVDISNPQETSFDVFKGECSDFDQVQINRILKSLDQSKTQVVTQVKSDVATLVCAGISKEQADKLWQQTYRTSLPLKIVNRDFERFDLRLDQAPDTPEVIEYLTTSTGMPESVAKKVLTKLPLIIHKNIRFNKLDEEIQKLKKLGAVSSGHLLVFQSFSLKINAVKNMEQTIELLNIIGGVDKKVIKESLLDKKIIEGPFTSPQVQWLQYELKKIGTTTNRILR